MPLPHALAAWRDGGGVLDISALSLDWNGLRLTADGTFALDRELQPEGALSARIDGVDKAVDSLVAAGTLDARAGFAVKIANKALAGGKDGATPLPLSIQERRFYAGPVPLFRLKPIRWE